VSDDYEHWSTDFRNVNIRCRRSSCAWRWKWLPVWNVSGLCCSESDLLCGRWRSFVWRFFFVRSILIRCQALLSTSNHNL